MLKILDLIEKMLDKQIEIEKEKIESWDAKDFLFDIKE